MCFVAAILGKIAKFVCEILPLKVSITLHSKFVSKILCWNEYPTYKSLLKYEHFYTRLRKGCFPKLEMYDWFLAMLHATT